MPRLVPWPLNVMQVLADWAARLWHWAAPLNARSS
jgi:hypothetical protein